MADDLLETTLLHVARLERDLALAAKRIADQDRELDRLKGLLRLDADKLGESLTRTGFRSIEELSRYASRSYRLAYFILGSEEQALEATCQTLRKLSSNLIRQDRRRVYWRQEERARRPRKAFLEPAQHCQLILLAECTALELNQEENIEYPCIEDLLLRYVKHLLEVSIGMHSSHLNVAISRILHGTTNKQTWMIQQLLQQRAWSNFSREYPSDPLKRRISDTRVVLEATLSRRFSRFLVREPRDDIPPLRPLTAAELELFGPSIEMARRELELWEAPECESLVWSVQRGRIKVPSFTPSSGYPEEAVEIARKAALICPACYSRISHVLGFPDPKSKIYIPHFTLPEDSGQNSENDMSAFGGRIPNESLKPEQLEHIFARLALDAEMRATGSLILSLRVEGQVPTQRRIETGQSNIIQVDERARRCEIFSESPNGPVPIATFPLSALLPGKLHTITFRNRTLSLRLTPRSVWSSWIWLAKRKGEPESAAAHSLYIFFDTGQEARPHESKLAPLLFWRPALALASLALIVLCFLWLEPLKSTTQTPISGIAFRQLRIDLQANRGDGPLQVLRVPRNANRLIVVVPVLPNATSGVYELDLWTPSKASFHLETTAIDDELSLDLSRALLVEGTYRLRIVSPLDEPGGSSPAEIKFQVILDD